MQWSAVAGDSTVDDSVGVSKTAASLDCVPSAIVACTRNSRSPSCTQSNRQVPPPTESPEGLAIDIDNRAQPRSESARNASTVKFSNWPSGISWTTCVAPLGRSIVQVNDPRSAGQCRSNSIVGSTHPNDGDGTETVKEATPSEVVNASCLSSSR